jgi:hypothetical protein
VSPEPGTTSPIAPRVCGKGSPDGTTITATGVARAEAASAPKRKSAASPAFKGSIVS